MCNVQVGIFKGFMFQDFTTIEASFVKYKILKYFANNKQRLATEVIRIREVKILEMKIESPCIREIYNREKTTRTVHTRASVHSLTTLLLE